MSNWLDDVTPVVDAVLADSAHDHWRRLSGTWFVGANVLSNDAQGSVSGGAALPKSALDVARGLYGALPLDRAQVSVIYPGYPSPRGETEAAHKYRIGRFSAHVDGLHALGKNRARHLREPHAFVLGIPLEDNDPAAAAMVVWPGSHLVMRHAFTEILDDLPPDQWAGVDMTNAYHAARRKVFQTCRPAVVHVPRGGAYLVHRHALHGVRPWLSPQRAARRIVYFRPEFRDWSDWLSAP